jgi:hypothetical protein
MVTFVVAAGIVTGAPVNTQVPAKTTPANVVPSIVTVPPPRLEPAIKALTPSRLPVSHGKQLVGWADPGSPPPIIEKFSPETLKLGPSKIPSIEREPLVTTRGSALTDGASVNIRKAHKTSSILDMEFSFKNLGFNVGGQGGVTIRNPRGDCQRGSDYQLFSEHVVRLSPKAEYAGIISANG